MTTFVDTSFFLAATRKKDALHERAVAWQKAVRGDLLTTEFVLTEFLDALASPSTRRTAYETVKLIRHRNVIRVVSATTELLESGTKLYALHEDKNWSVTDCVSFFVMRNERIHDALTADRDFEQAGFVALLRLDP